MHRDRARWGPESLPHFEDRVLYQLVDLTGGLPLPKGRGVSEGAIAERLSEELGLTPDVIGGPEFHSSSVRGQILAAVDELRRAGLADAIMVAGPWTIRPTLDGRRRVDEWREQWRRAQDGAVRRRILEELERQWRADPARHMHVAQIDAAALCAELGVDGGVYLANAQRLLEQGRIAQDRLDQVSLERGDAYITEAGRQELERLTAHHSTATLAQPPADAQAAWVEVARLKRRLALAERDLPSLIADPDLRRRCQDLLTADGDYDRAVREACVVLEDRVRTVAGADRSLTGTALMETVFSARRPVLRLATHEGEQRGAMELYRGVMAFFRNPTGHALADAHTREHALRIVVAVDLLLTLVGRAQPESTTSGQ